MIEALADLDDDIAHKFLEGEEIGADELRRAIRVGTLAYKIVPVLTGSALKNKGIQPMLDAVIDFLPSPLDVPPVTGRDARRRGGRSLDGSDRSRSRRSPSRSPRTRSSASSPSSGSTPAR